LRLDEGFADGITVNGFKPCSEGIKMGLDSLLPIGAIEDSVALGIIGSDGNTFGRGFSGFVWAKFKGIDDVILDIIWNATNVLEFKGLLRVHFVSL
jgi:hypothetical protein